MKISKFIVVVLIASNSFYSVLAMNTAGSVGSVPAIVNQSATLFDVTVPTSLPISVDSAGIVTRASNTKIINNSFGPVVIKNIEISANTGWNLNDYTVDFKKEKIGVKKFGISINGCNSSSGYLDSSSLQNIKILKGNYYDINYNILLGAQKTSIINETIANIKIIVDWWKDIESTGYTLATDSDFEWVEADYLSDGMSGYYHYVGTDDYVEIPSGIYGHEVNYFGFMFADNTTIKGVKGIVWPATNCEYMFVGVTSTSIDLSEFNMSFITRSTCMFSESNISTGYARNVQDAVKLNSIEDTSENPVQPVFSVK